MQEKKVKSIIVEKDNPHDAYGIVTYTNVSMNDIVAALMQFAQE